MNKYTKAKLHAIQYGKQIAFTKKAIIVATGIALFIVANYLLNEWLFVRDLHLFLNV